MSLKTASFLAFAGMLVLTALVIADLIRDTSGVVTGIIPAIRLVRSLIYMFASVAATLFFYVFYRRQS